MDANSPDLNVPFNMNYIVNPDGTALFEITNADERIAITELTRVGDTIRMKLPVFTSEIVALVKGDSLVGRYYPKGVETGNFYKFYAVAGVTDRFPMATAEAGVNISGRWRFVENPGTPDSSIMVAELRQEGNRLTGTILSTTGDYRYLEGKVSGNKFLFSKNDGAQTLILEADIVDANTIENGTFSGSPRWISKWRAVRDESIVLPKGEELVRVKKGYSTFDFAGKDLEGNLVTSKDPQFLGKVVAVLAGGSWCPNCLDEAKLYNQLYQKYKDRGFEVVSLNFEDKTFETSQKKMARFAKSTGATFPFLYVAPRGREARDSVLYPVEGKMAYPTSLMLDRRGNIRRVETGFSGPGTGAHYTEFVKETEQLIELLLSEK